MTGQPNLNLFLSYAHADSERVAKLHGDLERAGFNVWMDRSEILGGDWRTAIKRGLRRSNFFLACLSAETSERGEVLEFEWDSALEVQKEQLEGEVYLIPVRLAPCEVPEKLRHLQWIDLYEPDGLQRLLKVLRLKQTAGWTPARTATLLGLGMALLICAMGAWWLTRGTPVATFLSLRPGGKSNAGASEDFMLGITPWKLRAALPSDPSVARYLIQPQPAAKDSSIGYTPVRLALKALHTDDKVFFTVESSRGGYLYVADRELRTDGSKGPPLLIFPTERVNGGDFRVSAGHPIEVPDRFSDPNYFQVQVRGGSSYGGEQLTFFVASTKIPGIQLRAEAMPVSEELVQRWEHQWGSGVKQLVRDGDERVSSVSEAKAMAEGAALGVSDPPPQMIYSVRRKPGDPIAVTISLPASGRTQ